MLISIILLTYVAACHSAIAEITDIPNGQKVYYSGVCEINDCRYGSCEIYNATAYKCHCLKVYFIILLFLQRFFCVNIIGSHWTEM